MRLIAFLGPFTDRNDRFSTLLYTSSNEIPTLSYKKVPLSGGASLQYRLL